jgi:hypothetical protein
MIIIFKKVKNVAFDDLCSWCRQGTVAPILGFSDKEACVLQSPDRLAIVVIDERVDDLTLALAEAVQHVGPIIYQMYEIPHFYPLRMSAHEYVRAAVDHAQFDPKLN